MLLALTGTEINSFLIAAAVTIIVVLLARLLYRQARSGSGDE